MSLPHPRWFTTLSNLFEQQSNANGTRNFSQNPNPLIACVLVIQLATIDKTVPQVRSCIVRELVPPTGDEHLPIVLTTTDIRTSKVEQILANDTVQINWWITSSMDQFRLTGKVTLVPEPASSVFKSEGSLGFERISARGFDWEAKRVQVFDSLSGRMRACWCRPTPGIPMEGGYEEAKNWPETIPTTSEVGSEKEKKLVAEALGNFALVLVQPTFVDWHQLGTTPDRRTFFRREEDGSWTETIVVP